LYLKRKKKIVKKKRLLYIRSLMSISLLLLSVLIGSWLNTQFKEQKQQLQKDLQDDLASAKKEVSDSLLYINLIKPALKLSTLTSDIKVTNHDKPTGQSDFRIVISGADDTNKIKEIKEKILKSNNMAINIAHDKRSFELEGPIKKQFKTTYKLKQPEVPQDLLKEGVAMIVDEILQQTGMSGDSIFTFDTAHLRKSFTKKLDNKDLHFTTIWNENTKFIPNSKKKMIFISTDYLSKKYNVGINNYAGYLMKKMLPQVLFSLTLLLFVAAAFYISLRSLKEQMRLSIMKNDLISNMSHELKTPISTVKVALEALTTFNAAQNPQTTKEYLEMASLEMNRLDMLVNQALNTSLLEEGKIVIQKECVDLNKITQDISRMLQIRIKQNDADVTIQASGTDFTTKADPLHLQGVIINLIDNSLKYADKKPVIHVSIESNADTIAVSVADNGPGIPAEHIHHIFDKFYRVPHGDRHNVKGYGLGLSYSQQVALQHGGKITVKNQTSEGCIFTLTLPKISC
jgi:signal transduction histidine kinase